MKQDIKKTTKWMLIVVVVLLAVIAALIAMILKKEPQEPVPETVPATAAEETAEVAEAPEIMITEPILRDYEIVELVDGKIQTPYGDLNYPEGLADHLLIAKTSEQPYTIEFYATMEGKHELRLFDISLGEGSGGNMGMVASMGQKIPLNVIIYELEFDANWAESEIITAYAMQDVVNEMIDQMGPKLEEENREVTHEPVVNQQPEDTYSINNQEIETPYTTIYYPARWSKILTTVHDESQENVYKVAFYGKIEGKEKQLLFSIYFGGDEGEQLGAVMNQDGIPVSVNLLLEPLALDGWAPEDAEILYSMQDDVNQLIAMLPLLT